MSKILLEKTIRFKFEFIHAKKYIHLQNTLDKLKEELKQNYILTKIQSLTDAKHKEQNNSITNLPKFESDFVKLHENFFKT